MSIPAHLLVHEAVVEPYLGAGAYGDLYGPAFTLPCYYEEQRRLVRAADGTEAVSEGTLYADLAEVPTDSRVTVRGRETTVVATSIFDDDGLTGLAHMEVALA